MSSIVVSRDEKRPSDFDSALVRCTYVVAVIWEVRYHTRVVNSGRRERRTLGPTNPPALVMRVFGVYLIWG